MANYATFDFRFMLVHKRALLLRVAFVSDFISRSTRAKLLRPESSMRTMAVIALDETLIHAMMEWSSELGANLHVAGVAQPGRLSLQHELRFLRKMRRMALNAADAARQVG